MGNDQSQTYKSIQDVSNSIVQQSTQICNIKIDQQFDDNTVIIIGSSGGVVFEQRAVIENATCNMTQSLDAMIETTLESMSMQDAESKGGFSINWTSIDQEISIYQYVKNSITQIMTAECNIAASQTMNNNYIYVEDTSGGILFSQTAQITDATCNLNSAASSSVYNTTKAGGDQTSKVVQINPLLAALGLCMILGFIVFMIILFKGSGGGGESEGGGGGPTISLSGSM